MKKIDILFNGKNEILDVIDNNSSIIKYLGLPRSDCALIGAEIQAGKELGRGNHGAAYEITLPGMGPKKYVMKVNELALEYLTTYTKAEITEMLEAMELTFDDIAPLQLTQEYIDYFERADYEDLVKVVMPPEICKLAKDVTYPAVPKFKSYFGFDVDTITVPKGSYLCLDKSFSEYIIGVYLGKIYREGKCINFFDVHAMLTCDAGNVVTTHKDGTRDIVYNQFIFMDRIDGGFKGQSHCVRKALFEKAPKAQRDYAIDSVFVQTIFAIAYYQETLKMSHNDLHTDNVFVEYVTKDTRFNGETVAGADLYRYVFNGRELHFPACPMLSKIGDFGFSVKFSDPIVGSREVMQDGFYAPIDDTGKNFRAFFPNSFIPSYDSLYFTLAYAGQVSTVNGDNGHILPDSITPLLNKCLQFLGGNANIKLNRAGVYGYRNLYSMAGLIYSDARPVMEKLVEGKVKTARELLEGPIAEYYRDLPIKGKIVTLGEL